MTLREYFSTQQYGSKSAMAKALGITKNWMSQLILGQRRCSAELAVSIAKYTKNKVRARDLRPDIF